MINLGNLTEDQVVDFIWPSNAADGSAITRATNGTISVYKGNSTTQTTAGVTDTEDFDGVTGIHHCRIDTSADAFYAVANDYSVVLSGATIDGKTVNTVLAVFSIENRFQEADAVKWLGTAIAAPDTAGYPKVTVKDGTGTGEIDTTSGKVAIKASGIDANSFDAGAITNASIATGAISATKFAVGAINAAALDTDAAEEIADAMVGSTEFGTLNSNVTAILADTADMQPKLGTPAGASISADIAAIEAQTDDIGTAGAGLTAIPWNPAWDAEVQSEVTDGLDAYDPPTRTEATADKDAILAKLPAALVGGRMDASVGAMAANVITAAATAADFLAEINAECDTALLDAGVTTTVTGRIDAAISTRATPAQVKTQADTALTDIHLDHLLAADYDPASKPGVATALLNELIESDSGVSRYTVNALENAPSGSGASAATIADAVWDEALSGHAVAGSAGEALTDASAGGGGGSGDTIIMGPLVASREPGNRTASPITLEMFQGSAKTFALAVVDAAGEPVDLSAFDLRFIVLDANEFPTAQFKVEEPELTVSGDDDEIANIPVTAEQSATAGANWRWRLIDITTSQVVAHGAFKITPSVMDT